MDQRAMIAGKTLWWITSMKFRGCVLVTSFFAASPMAGKSLQKSFGWLGERGVRLRLRVDAFNVFNHTQFSGINSTLNFNQAGVPQNLAYDSTGKLVNPNGFGTVNGARDPRVLQTQLKFEF